MSTNDVIEQIEEAFADTPSPGDEFDDISATLQDEGIVEYFRGKSWHGHHVQDLLYHTCALSFFTDKAFRYWLPAFMLAVLKTPEETIDVLEAIVFHLTNENGRRFRHVSEIERRAIIAFLAECEGRYS